MVDYEEYEYEDEEYDDEEYDEYDEYEDDEYEDDYQDEYNNRRRYDEDFDAVSVEPEVKTAIGIDGFAVIFSFVILLAASFLLARYTLLEVYDQSFLGVIPPKEKPDVNNVTLKVNRFGCDKTISNVYNYAILDGGINKDIEKGMVLYMGNKAVAQDKETEANGAWGICFVVSEVYQETCRADIVRVMTVKKPELASAVKTIDGGGAPTDSETGRWTSLATMTELMKNLNWLLKDETISDDMRKVRIAPWDDRNQWILLKYSPTPRVAKKKK